MNAFCPYCGEPIVIERQSQCMKCKKPLNELWDPKEAKTAPAQAAPPPQWATAPAQIDYASQNSISDDAPQDRRIWIVLVVALGLIFILGAILLLPRLFNAGRSLFARQPTATPTLSFVQQFALATPEPTWLPELIEPSPTPAATAAPTPAPAETCAASSRLTSSEYGVVMEGSGYLRLRNEPNLSAKIISRIDEGDPAQLLEGPVCNAGVVWWKVVAVESKLTGWAAEMRNGDYYLKPAP